MPRPQTRIRTTRKPTQRALVLGGRVYPMPSEDVLVERARTATAKLKMARTLASLGLLAQRDDDDEYSRGFDDRRPLDAEELRLQSETRARLAAIRKPFILPSTAPSTPQVLLRLDAQASDLPDGQRTIAQLIEYLKGHDASFAALSAAEQHVRAIALRDALRTWTGGDKSASLSRGNGTASKPLLLLSAWPGRNRTEQAVAMLVASQPSLRRAPWERLAELAADTVNVFDGRII